MTEVTWDTRPVYDSVADRHDPYDRLPVDGQGHFDSLVAGGPLPGTAIALDGFVPRETVRLQRDEEQLLNRLPPRRRADFAAGRRAAARALAALGRAGPVLREGRRPLFPPGVRGSISHCVGHLGACIATTNPAVAATGIDLERTDRLTPGTVDLICTPREARWVTAARQPQRRLSVVFSAKEAAYKALSALAVPREPVFHDVDLLITGDRIGICVNDGLLPKGHHIFGWLKLIRGGYALTAVAVVTEPHTGIPSHLNL